MKAMKAIFVTFIMVLVIMTTTGCGRATTTTTTNAPKEGTVTVSKEYLETLKFNSQKNQW